VWSRLLIFLVFCFVLCWFFFYLSSSCVLCTQCCQCLWIVHTWLPLCFSLYLLSTFMSVKISHFGGFFLLPKTFKLFGLKYFGFGCTWGWLFQKWVVLIKSDIYFFFYISGVYNNILWKLNFYTITCHESFNVSSSC